MARALAPGGLREHTPICLRIPVEWRASLDAYCAANHVTISEVARTGLGVVIGQAGYEEMFLGARELAYQMARRLIARVVINVEQLPASYAEAAATMPDVFGHGLFLQDGLNQG